MPPDVVALCEKNPERELCDLMKQIVRGREKSNVDLQFAAVELTVYPIKNVSVR
jgi:hypothetical protein